VDECKPLAAGGGATTAGASTGNGHGHGSMKRPGETKGFVEAGGWHSRNLRRDRELYLFPIECDAFSGSARTPVVRCEALCVSEAGWLSPVSQSVELPTRWCARSVRMSWALALTHIHWSRVLRERFFLLRQRVVTAFVCPCGVHVQPCVYARVVREVPSPEVMYPDVMSLRGAVCNTVSYYLSSVSWPVS